jgi:hypothetical protein
MNSQELMTALKRPFEEKQISWRVGSTNQDKSSGLALAYIDARDVMHRLDNLFPMEWQDRYHTNGNKTFCEIGLFIEGQWLWRSDGAGDTDVEAEKGAISDAFKRAAVKWGIGQYLYALPQQWFDLTPAGRSYKLAGTPTLPKWATPKGYDEIMAKRARTKSGDTITAKSGVWEDLDEAQQREVQDVVDTIRQMIEGEIPDWTAINSIISEQEDYFQIAMWTRFDSKETTLITKMRNALKAKQTLKE